MTVPHTITRTLAKVLPQFEGMGTNNQVLENLDVLTSLPTRSSLFSTIPQGAIPMAMILFFAFSVLSLIASPTCRVTPGEFTKIRFS